MRKGLKIALRMVGYVLLFLILFVIVVPLMFKDEIIEVVRRSIDQRIEGAFYFEKAQVGILRTFPNLCVHLTSPVLTGGAHPDGDSLFVAEALDITVDIKSLLQSGVPVKVVGIEAVTPRISLYTDTNGITNYQLISPDTTATDTTASALVVDIEHYGVSQARVRYVDEGSELEILAAHLNHQGQLHYKDDVVTLETETEQGLLTIQSGNTAYLKGVHVSGTNDLSLDFANSIYTLLDNTLTLNALQIGASGSITQTEEDVSFDLVFSGERSAFKDLISLLPNLYASQFEALRASGNIALVADLKGTLSETSVPVYHLSLQVDNGAFQYPNKPFGFNNVAFQGSLHNTNKSWQPDEILIPKMHFDLNQQPFDAHFIVQHPSNEPTYEGMVNGRLDLAALMIAYPLPDVSALSGLVEADISFDIDASRPASGQMVSGNLSLKGVNVKTGDEEIIMQNGIMDFTPAHVHAVTQTTTWNGTSVKADITAREYINWITDDQEMTVTGNVAMEKFDANRYLTPANQSLEADPAFSLYPGLSQIRFNGIVSVDTLIYESYIVHKATAVLAGTLQSLEVVQTEGEINGTRFTANGSFGQITEYMEGSGPLVGSLDCRLDKIYVDRWIEDETIADVTSSGTETAYVALPEAITLDVTFRADRLLYDKIEIEDPHGSLHVENQVLEIHDFNGRGMGGDIKFSGLYNTQNTEHPAFNIKYGLKSLRINEAFRQIETFQILAPVVKFVHGTFNSDFVLEGRLGENYMPDFSTLTASGFLETLSSSIQQAEVMNKVSQFLNLKKPLQWDLTNTRNWFEIKDGYVLLQEVTKSIDGIEVGLGGRHKIQGEMDYLIKLNIPADRISANPVGALAKTGFEQLQSKAATYGVKLNSIDNFIVHLAMRGKFTDPKFEILLFDASGKSLKDVATKQLEEIKGQLQDTLSTMAKEKGNALRDSVRNVIDAAVDSARLAAEEKLKEKGKEILLESTAKLDSTLRDSITNAVLKNLGEKGLENLGQKESDKIKDALDKWDPFKKKKKGQ